MYICIYRVKFVDCGDGRVEAAFRNVPAGAALKCVYVSVCERERMCVYGRVGPFILSFISVIYFTCLLAICLLTFFSVYYIYIHIHTHTHTHIHMCMIC
jgi:hypothetical protein